MGVSPTAPRCMQALRIIRPQPCTVQNTNCLTCVRAIFRWPSLWLTGDRPICLFGRKVGSLTTTGQRPKCRSQLAKIGASVPSCAVCPQSSSVGWRVGGVRFCGPNQPQPPLPSPRSPGKHHRLASEGKSRSRKAREPPGAGCAANSARDCRTLAVCRKNALRTLGPLLRLRDSLCHLSSSPPQRSASTEGNPATAAEARAEGKGESDGCSAARRVGSCYPPSAAGVV